MRFEGGGVYSGTNTRLLAAAEVGLGRSGTLDGGRRVRELGFLVLGMGTGAVLTLDKVDSTVVWFVAAVDLNVGFGVSLDGSGSG